jgi:hypothetical protein
LREAISLRNNRGAARERNLAAVGAFPGRGVSHTDFVGRLAMRVIFGMILGALITVGAAYVHDNWSSPAPTDQRTTVAGNHKMVNWDVVSSSLRGARKRARDAWNSLSQKSS